MGMQSSETIEKNTLYIVATPLGNLADFSPRAAWCCQQVDLILAEDTRHSHALMRQYAITTPMLSCHQHNEQQRIEKILSNLQDGKSLALISDAGTPLISDPGARCVRAVQEAGFRVCPIPGPSAVVTALSASGFAGDSFVFSGFLPAKGARRREVVKQWKSEVRTVVAFEAPHRIVDCLQLIVEVCGGERQVCIARELTKRFETIKRDASANLLQWIKADENQQRGEFVVLIEGAEVVKSEGLDENQQHVLRCLLEELPLKTAVKVAVKITGCQRNALYQQALDWQ